MEVTGTVGVDVARAMGVPVPACVDPGIIGVMERVTASCRPLDVDPCHSGFSHPVIEVDRELRGVEETVEFSRRQRLLVIEQVPDRDQCGPVDRSSRLMFLCGLL